MLWDGRRGAAFAAVKRARVRASSEMFLHCLIWVFMRSAFPAIGSTQAIAKFVNHGQFFVIANNFLLAYLLSQAPLGFALQELCLAGPLTRLTQS